MVVGPFADVHDALPYVGLVQAAILDVKVQNEPSFQVADSLNHHDIPFVFLTGYHPHMVPARFKRRHVYSKPRHAGPLLHDLHERHRVIVPSDADTAQSVVIEMMLRAWRLMPSEAAAERLVEASLLRAIAEAYEGRCLEDNIRTRLLGLLDEEYRQRGKLFLQ
jgi:hypothetical protein